MGGDGGGKERELSRRRFLRDGLVAATAIAASPWLPAAQAADPAAPPGFPRDIELVRRTYENWSREILVDDVWTAVPRTASDVVRLTNWARAAGYRLRPSGMQHNWSPLTIANDATSARKVVLVDTTQHLTRMQLEDRRAGAVRVEAGATMDRLLDFLGAHGLGFTAVPATGGITIGGVLAIDGHGTGVPATDEVRRAGQTYGTLSNTVTSLTAVVWDAAAARYTLRTFDRGDPRCGAFLTHLGRAFVTDVTLSVGRDQRMRCQSFTDVPISELAAAPDDAGARSVAAYLDRTGRLEVIWYPFTDRPWLKVWSVSPSKPSAARAVTGPYNYAFSDSIPKDVAALADDLVTSRPEAAPVFGQLLYGATVGGLLATRSSDIWGASKDVMRYIRASTLRVAEFGYVVLTQRSSTQKVVHEFVSRFSAQVAAYEADGKYPINMPVEIRVSGVDTPAEIAHPATPPLLSAASPVPGRDEWDTAIWLNVLSLPGTADTNPFLRELEGWVRRRFTPPFALTRPEWAKGWAYTDRGAWTNRRIIDATRSRFRTSDWSDAVAVLDEADPHRVFTSPLITDLLTSTS